jgi:hypothetical protein
MHLRSGKFLMVNASINFKYHRTATIVTKLNKVKKKSIHCPFMSTYYWHNAHENFTTTAASSKLDIKGCTIRQKQKEISVVTKSDIHPAYQITC